MKIIVFLLWILCVSFTVQAADDCGEEGAALHVGKVISHFTSGDYTYIQIMEGNKKTWVALLKTKVRDGQHISFPHSPPMIDFEHKSGRKFKEIYFAPGFAYVSSTCVSKNIPVNDYADVPIKDWFIGAVPDESVYAATANDSGSMFGQYCYYESSSCIYMIGMTASCEAKALYPSLANSENRASNIQIQCGGKFEMEGKTYYGYLFSDFNDIDNLVHGSKAISFAIPIEGAKFRSLRFSLDGAKEAVKAMRDFAAEKFVGDIKEGDTDTKINDQVF